MKKFSLLLTFLVLASTVSPAARSGSLYCTGKVAQLGYHQPGTLFLMVEGMNYPVGICNTNYEWIVAGSAAGNTSVSSCKTLYATLLAAKVEKTVITALFDSDTMPSTCASFAPWTNVNLRALTSYS